MGKPLRVLLVDDSEDDALLVVATLRKGGYDPLFELVDTREDMLESLQRGQWDIIISDFNMPRFSGPEALSLLQSTGIDIPFIAVSGAVGEDAAVSILKAGAHDFMLKSNMARMVTAVERELREAEKRAELRLRDMELRESEERFRTLFQATFEGLMIHEEGRILLANQAFAEQFGYEHPAELVDRLGFELLTPESQELTRERMRLNIPGAYEVIGLRPDGSTFPAETQAKKIYYGGKLVRFVAMRDITERKKAEARIKRQLEQLRALHRIDLEIGSNFRLESILNVILEQVIDQLGVDAADIWILRQGMPWLEYAAGMGFLQFRSSSPPQHIEDSLAGQAVRQRKLVEVASLSQVGFSAEQKQLTSEEGFVTYYAAPLIAKGQVKGVLEVFHRSSLVLDAERKEFLDTLAGQTAIALDNMSLFEDLQRKNLDLTLAYDATIEGWSRALDLRDHETENHTQRVTEMTLRLARRIGIQDDELLHIRWGALLHDIGKMGVPDTILLKDGPLNEDEWSRMRMHPTYAFQLLAPINFLHRALDIPYCHHEWWNGSGYPRHLQGQEIPLPARVFSIVDVWDALRSDRPYRKAWTDDKVFEYIRSLAGVQFDPEIVQKFIEMLGSD